MNLHYDVVLQWLFKAILMRLENELDVKKLYYSIFVLFTNCTGTLGNHLFSNGLGNKDEIYL